MIQTRVVSSDTIRVQWRAPTDLGGRQVLGYYLWYGTSPDFELTSSNLLRLMSRDSLSTEVGNLTGGETYFFKVAAVNGVTGSDGQEHGEVSSPGPTAGVALKLLPGEPVIDSVATSSRSSALVQWSPPSSDGFGTITAYNIDYSMSPSFTGTTYTIWISTASTKDTAGRLSTEIKGLDPGVEYFFRLAAVNEVGKSEYSETMRVQTGLFAVLVTCY